MQAKYDLWNVDQNAADVEEFEELDVIQLQGFFLNKQDF